MIDQILSIIQSMNFDTSGHDTNSRLMQDIGLDSLDFAQLVLAMEDATDTLIPDDTDWLSIKTISDLAALFEVRS